MDSSMDPRADFARKGRCSHDGRRSPRFAVFLGISTLIALSFIGKQSAAWAQSGSAAESAPVSSRPMGVLPTLNVRLSRSTYRIHVDPKSGAAVMPTDVVAWASLEGWPLERVAAGDFVAIWGAGAYGMVQASNYNGRGRPAEVLVEGKRAKLIRRRETAEDLVRTDVLGKS